MARRVSFKPKTKPRGRETLRDANPGRPGFGQGIHKPSGTREDWMKAAVKPGFSGASAGGGAPKAKPPTAPGSPGFVPDSVYNRNLGDIAREETSDIADIDKATREVDRTFVDPTNPFSRSEELKRQYLARRKGASASLAAEGQLYSGAHQRALSKVRLDEERSLAELRDAYDKEKARLDAAKGDVRERSQEERDQEFQEWLDRNPDAVASVPPAGAPAPTAAPPAAPAAPASKPAPKESLVDTSTPTGKALAQLKQGGPIGFGKQAAKPIAGQKKRSERNKKLAKVQKKNPKKVKKVAKYRKIGQGGREGLR